MFFFLECLVGLYGDYCNNYCGNCLNNINCYYVNGICFEECDLGYYEYNCIEGEYFY